MSDDFALLKLLDSPLLAALAPELVPLKSKVLELAKPKPGCGPCQERQRYADLLKLQQQLSGMIESNPQLKAIAPQLVSSAKQVYDGRKL